MLELDNKGQLYHHLCVMQVLVNKVPHYLLQQIEEQHQAVWVKLQQEH